MQKLCEQLLATLRTGGQVADDTVVLALRPVPVKSRAFRRSFPARAEELRLLRSDVREWLEAQGIPSSERNDIVLALGEACANAVEHAYGTDPGGEIDVEITNVMNDVTVSVRDYGAWRKKEVHEPAGDAERGRGYMIMRAVSERLDVDAGLGGTTVTLQFSAKQDAT